MSKRAVDAAFWDAQHTHQEIRYLTGSTLSDVLRIFEPVGDLKAEIAQGRVLDVGLGLGGFILATPKPRYGLEISSAARARFAAQGVACFAPSDPPAALNANVAVCLLVAQHVDDTELARLFTWVRTALKPRAPFYVQSADGTAARDERYGDLPAGYGIRTPERVVEIGRNAGFEHVRCATGDEYPAWSLRWNLARFS